MRKIDLKQGSEEWLRWRRSLLTATDAPMLMGASPYVTPYKGWQRKLGMLQEQHVTPAMERGIRDEPIARKMFIEEYGIEMAPCVIESSNYNFLGASLDGMSPCGRYLLEVKSNGDHYHNNLDKEIPDFHMMQMQHQLLCTDTEAEMCFYVSYNNGRTITKTVKPDLEWLQNYMLRAREFWKGVTFFEPPALTNKDYKDMASMPLWNDYAYQYDSLNDQIKQLEERKCALKKKIIELCGEDSCSGNGMKVLKKVTRGRVDYDSIPEIATIDLEKYRKPSSSSWTIMLDQK